MVRGHHDEILDHARDIACRHGQTVPHVVASAEDHRELHAHIRATARATGTSEEKVRRVVACHAADETHDHNAKRSDKWPTFRKHWLRGDAKLGIVAHDSCASCASKIGLQVHHVTPFQVNHALECDDTYRNYITVCESIVDEEGRPGKECHLHIAHGGSHGGFHAYNPDVVADAAEALAHPERWLDIAARIAKKARPIP